MIFGYSIEQILYYGTYVISAITVIGSLLNIGKLRAGFYFWIIANLLWLAYDLYQGVYGRAVVDTINTAVSIIGAYAWRKPKNKKGGKGNDKHDKDKGV